MRARLRLFGRERRMRDPRDWNHIARMHHPTIELTKIEKGTEGRRVSLCTLVRALHGVVSSCTTIGRRAHGFRMRRASRIREVEEVLGRAVERWRGRRFRDAAESRWSCGAGPRGGVRVARRLVRWPAVAQW
jgi:hypothetical protein